MFCSRISNPVLIGQTSMIWTRIECKLMLRKMEYVYESAPQFAAISVINMSQT